MHVPVEKCISHGEFDSQYPRLDAAAAVHSLTTKQRVLGLEGAYERQKQIVGFATSVRTRGGLLCVWRVWRPVCCCGAWPKALAPHLVALLFKSPGGFSHFPQNAKKAAKLVETRTVEDCEMRY